MDEPAVFPVALMALDEDRFDAFESLEAIEGTVEPIDVENGEYKAWDALGRPVVLSVKAAGAPVPMTGVLKSVWRHGWRAEFPASRERNWLGVRLESQVPDPAFETLLRSFLTRCGVHGVSTASRSKLLMLLKDATRSQR